MLKIGITGGIGSGKSTASKMFATFGVPVYYSDDAAKELLATDAMIKDEIVNLLGTEVLDENNDLIRKKIADRVFNDEIELKKLNSIIHPAVVIHFNEWLKKHEAYPYILMESAILFESGAYLEMDKIITVTAPYELRMSRVIKRDSTSAEAAQRRMDAQISEKERIKRSQYVIVNDEVQPLHPQVTELHQHFTKLFYLLQFLP